MTTTREEPKLESGAASIAHNDDDVRPARPRWRRAPWIGGVAAVVVVLVIAVVAVTSGGDSGSGGNVAALRSATVTRRDLVARLSFDGTLGYVNPVTISAHAASAASSTTSASSSRGGSSASSAGSTTASSGTSTVTSIASSGQIVMQGQPLFALDNEPTVLLYGSTPAYRQLSTSSTPGPDILQLETNLAELGYNPGTVDGTYTSMTALAVKSWEQALGRANPDRIVELGEVVFENGPVRVGTHNVEVGATVGGGASVMQVTGTTRVVTVNVDASRQDLVHAGNNALVTFPDGSTAEGLIFAVSKVAASSSSSQTTTGGNQGSGATATTASATVPVTILLPATATVPDLDQAPVTVGITQQEKKNALSVPVTALLALSEGGYGLQIVAPSGLTRIVPVQVGVYADGYVEVSGVGISPGLKVVTA